VLRFVPEQAADNGHRLALRAHWTNSVFAVKAVGLRCRTIETRCTRNGGASHSMHAGRRRRSPRFRVCPTARRGHGGVHLPYGVAVLRPGGTPPDPGGRSSLAGYQAGLLALRGSARHGTRPRRRPRLGGAMAYQCPYGMVIVVNAAGGQYRVLRQPVPGSAGQAWRQRVARCSGAGEARAASGGPRGNGGPGQAANTPPGHGQPGGGS